MVSHSRQWLSCSGCGDEFTFATDYVFQYTDLESIDDFDDTEGHSWSVLSIPCWCIDCNRPTFAERVPSLDEVMKAAGVKRIPEGDRTHEIHDELLYLEPELLARFATMISIRVSPPRCLLCGGQSFIPIDPWDSKTGLRHDTCGSDLKFHWQIVGSIGRREFRYYTPEGILLKSLWGLA